MNGDLIACARYRIYDLKAQADEGQITHVLYIVHLPRQTSSSLVSFQGDPWISAHIDDLMPSANDVIAPHEAVGVPISNLFIGGTTSPLVHDGIVPPCDSDAHEAAMELSVEAIELHHYDEKTVRSEQFISVSTDDEQLVGSVAMSTEGSDIATEEHLHISPFMDESSSLVYPVMPSSYTRRPLFRRLYNCIQPAASKLKDFIMKRSTKRIELLIHLIPKDICDDLGM